MEMQQDWKTLKRVVSCKIIFDVLSFDHISVSLSVEGLCTFSDFSSQFILFCVRQLQRIRGRVVIHIIVYQFLVYAFHNDLYNTFSTMKNNNII